MNRPAFSVRNLSVAFRRPTGLETVVDGISFDLAAGETVALVGESGSGKSVTAMALMGLLSPAEAVVCARQIALDGREIGNISPREWQEIRGSGMAMVFQEPSTALDPVLAIGTQIGRVLRRCRGMGQATASKAALDALEAVGFSRPDRVYRAYPHQLSGGMRQLVMIAMAMAVQPRVLIADEPTTALDVTTQALVIEKLKQLKTQQGTAILLVTHDLGVAARSCQQAMVMYCGRLVEQAPYAQLFRHPRHPYTRGLLKAVPRVHKGHPEPVQGIPGRIPALSDWTGGCHFAPRCQRADGLCRARFPATEEQGASRVACHHPL